MAPGPSRRSLEQHIAEGLQPNSDGSPMQRDCPKLYRLTHGQVVQKKSANSVYVSMELLLHHVLDLNPLMQTVVFLTVYVIARQCSQGGILRMPVRFIGGELTFEEYKAIVDVYNPASGYRLGEVISNLHLHPVYKDQGADRFCH